MVIALADLTKAKCFGIPPLIYSQPQHRDSGHGKGRSSHHSAKWLSAEPERKVLSGPVSATRAQVRWGKSEVVLSFEPGIQNSGSNAGVNSRSYACLGHGWSEAGQRIAWRSSFAEAFGLSPQIAFLITLGGRLFLILHPILGVDLDDGQAMWRVMGRFSFTRPRIFSNRHNQKVVIILPGPAQRALP